MDRDVLSEVIEVEKEIQRRLELEKAESHEWLERTRKKLEEEYMREERSIAESLRQSTEAARQDAEIKASAIITTAERTAGLLAAVMNGPLSRIVEKRIRNILPG